MRDRRTAYWYLTVFDPGAAEMSPGTLLFARGAELALEGGLAVGSPVGSPGELDVS